MIIFLVYFVEAWVSYAIFTVMSYYLGAVLLIHPVLIGLVGSVGLIPLALKLVVAPVIDKYKLPFFAGSKWSWLVLGLVFNGAFLALFAIDIKTFLGAFVVILFLQSTGMVILDATIDALAVQSKEHQTSVQASIGMFSGVLLGGLLSFLFVPVFEMSYPMWYIVMGFVVLCFIPIINKVKEGINLDAVARAPESKGWSVVKELFRSKSYLLVIVISFLFNIDAGMLEFTLEPYMGLVFGATLSNIAEIYLVTFAASVAVIVLFYKFQEQVKSRLVTALILISVYSGVLALCMSGLILTQVITFNSLVLIYMLWGAFSGATNMLVFALFVEHASVRIPAFSIVLLLSVSNAGRLLGVAVGGFIPIGFIYLISAILLISRIIPLFLLRQGKK